MIRIRVAGLFTVPVILSIVVACSGTPTTTVSPASRQAQKQAQASGSSLASPSPHVSPSPTASPSVSPTPTPHVSPSPTASSSVSPTPTPHVGVNPIKDPWPKLDASEVKTVDDALTAANKLEGEEQSIARKKVLATLVEILKRHCCNFDQVKDGSPTYNPNRSFDGMTYPIAPGDIRQELGRGAFGRHTTGNKHEVGGTVSWLYSTVKHELVHAQQFQDPARIGEKSLKNNDSEAYGREIDQAGNTGLSKDELAEVTDRLTALQKDPPADSGREEARLELSIAVPQGELLFGGPVRLTVTLRNVADHPLRVNVRLAVNAAVEPAEFGELTFVIHAPNGELAQFGADIRIGEAGPENAADLTPGQEVKTTVDLADYFFLVQRGTYLATAAYRNVSPFAVQVGPIESNVVTFTLH